MAASKGRQATSTGSTLEKSVMAALQNKGFEVAYYRDWDKKKEKFGSELLLKNVPFITVYDHSGNTEFLLKSAKHQLNIRIECKWQQEPGSVDEKLPYVYLNCIERMPEDHIIVIIDGGGFRPWAVDWLKNATKQMPYTTDKNKNKRIEVMDLKEFLRWANNTFR